MIRVVVKDHERPDPRRIGEARPFLPGRMSPVLVGRVFLVGVGAVVDHHIGAIDQPHHVPVGLAADPGVVLGVGDVGGHLAGIFDPVAGGPVRVIERRGAQRDARVGYQRLAGGEIVKGELGGEDVERHREQRRRHHLAEHVLDPGIGLQMAGPDPDMAARVVTGREERQADDVVEMSVAVEQVEIERLRGPQQLLAKRPQARAAVEDQQVRAAADFDAGRIAAIADRIGAGAGDAAAYSPETHREIRVDQRPPILLRRLIEVATEEPPQQTPPKSVSEAIALEVKPNDLVHVWVEFS